MIEFYKYHLNSLLNSKNNYEKNIVICPNSELTRITPHAYLTPLLDMLQNNCEAWPYKLRISKLAVILRELLGGVSL